MPLPSVGGSGMREANRAIRQVISPKQEQNKADTTSVSIFNTNSPEGRRTEHGLMAKVIEADDRKEDCLVPILNNKEKENERCRELISVGTLRDGSSSNKEERELFSGDEAANKEEYFSSLSRAEEL